MSVQVRVELEEMEAKLWKAMVNAECPNTLNMLKVIQNDIYQSLLIIVHLGVAESTSTSLRKRQLFLCAQRAKNAPLEPEEGRPYMVLVSLEKLLVPVLMNRDDMCDYHLFTKRIKERVPLYDPIEDYGWQHWETCRNQKNFFKLSNTI
jgi:hypothetical protein